MKIIHASDLHGHFEIIDKITDDADLVVITGDFFPNKSRGDVRTEIRHQTKWFGWKSPSILRVLRGLPVLWCPGNHDYVSLAEFLRRDGHTAYDISTDGVEILGLQFAGFGEIPFIAGEWNGESTIEKLNDLVKRTLDVGNPDILVTHAPPSGILDHGCHNGGIASLTSHLFYRPNRVTHHLFGHIHECGGQMAEENGVKFYNGACHARVIEILTPENES